MPFPDKNIKVLVADDKPNMVRTIIHMLRRLGFQNLSHADDGDTALAKARGIQKMDLILCDWNMPRMTGIEVLRAIRDDDQLKNTCFIMITAEQDPGTVAEAGEVDVDSYLLKPFTQEDLKTKIEQAWERKRTPSPVDTQIALAEVYIEAGQYDQALKELKSAMQMAPRSPRVTFSLGRLYEAKGEMESALKAYERTIEFGPKFLKGHEALARVYNNMGDLQAASKHLKAAVNLSPKNLDRQFSLTKWLIETGQKSEAQKVLQNVMKIADKTRSDITRQVGEAFLQAGFAEDAQGAFSKALESDPNDIQLYNRLGIALRRQKKFLEAVAYYAKAIQIDPQNENLYYNIGRAYYEAGDKSRSIGAIKKALQVYPEFEEARVFLGKLTKDES
ncbi:MAG: tetratricopeptide repeat protein [Pseudomonadota bacterium]